MTDQEYVRAVEERLRRAAGELLALLDQPGRQFQERLRRWKQRTAAYIKAHVSDEEATRFEGISVKWDPAFGDSFNGMVEAHHGFLITLADEVGERPEVLNPTDVAAAPVLRSRPFRVFISHAAPDKPLALAVQELLVRCLPDTKTFVSSRPGHISTGTSWWERITKEIRLAEAFIVLLTPASVQRPWISFETGAAWYSRRPLLTLTHGIEKGDVPWPMQGLQLSSLSDPEELSQALTKLGVNLEDPSSVAGSLGAIT